MEEQKPRPDWIEDDVEVESFAKSKRPDITIVVKKVKPKKGDTFVWIGQHLERINNYLRHPLTLQKEDAEKLITALEKALKVKI